MTTVKKVPYVNGSILRVDHYARYPQWGAPEGYELRDNEPFSARLVLSDKIYGTTKTAYFILVDDEDHKYPVFASDMVDIIRFARGAFGEFRATWIVGRKSTAYGLQYYGPPDEKVSPAWAR